MSKRLTQLGALIVSFLGVFPGEAGQLKWGIDRDARWTELDPPQLGKTGFTLISSDQTGISFTNHLDEWSSAANRVLENGSGVAVGDFDKDGQPDIFLCSLTGQNALYRNLGKWRFEDVTAAAGVNATNFVCRGATFADINGDGSLDLLISTLGYGVLCFLNDGQGKFTNSTQLAGTETKLGSTTLALADIDGDGTLDLYVTNYRTEDIRDRSRVEIQRINGRVVLAPALRDRLILTDSGLLEYGEPDILYLNDGKGHFKPVSWTSGTFLDESGKPLAAQPLDWGLSATFRDLNGDGFPDLYVCNDYWTPDRIWINDGKGRFQALARLALRHTSENSMGVDFADIDRDGHVDCLVLDMLSRDPGLRKRQVLAQTKMPATIGEIANRPQIMRNTLFHNRGDGTFAEIADFCNLPASEWSWQPVFIDVDLDGYEDLIIPAGHTRDVQDLDASMRIKSLQHPWPKDMTPKAHQEAFTREMMEHARLYPKLEMPIVAFRNLGNLRFEDVTQQWGTTSPGVHQGIALADFDGDGDLDFVVNNLNGPCSLYRNESIAARVAVRLAGLSPNTQGIGARVTLLGSPLPTQSQELVCGGRYLSASEPLLVFAAGSATNELTIEVTWRSGKRSVVPHARANRLYEIDESGAGASDRQSVGASERGSVKASERQSVRAEKPEDHAPGSTLRTLRPPPQAPRLFEDVSNLINHTHVENAFDDFARQPLLPRRLSQLGPGVCWFDFDGDGHDDLIVGSGQGGQMAICRNDGHGGFERLKDSSLAAPVPRDQTGVVALQDATGRTLVLAGSSNYEDGRAEGSSVRQYDLTTKLVAEPLPGQASSTGPLALADFDGDGDLDLFVGGRVNPGRYPEPVSSRIYQQVAGGWRLDIKNSRLLENLGLISGAVWSDLDGDGFPELILASDWGPIRVFKNQAGELHDATADWGLDQYAGWWTGVTTGDIDSDGKLDIVAGNWGLNSPYRASSEQPLRLYYGDLMGRGTVDLFETEYDFGRQTIVPRHRLDFMAAGLPLLRRRFATFKAFSEAGAEEALGELRNRASILHVNTLASMVFFNRGLRFEGVELPREAQFAPAFSVQVSDFDGDGHEDIFLSQNFFAMHWEMHRLDAGRGLLLQGDGTGKLRAVPGQESGLEIYGEQRGAAVSDFNEDGRIDLAVTQNGAATKLFQNVTAKPGLRVRLIGPHGNPAAVGAATRLLFGHQPGPLREVHAGSGYWSQDSAVQVLGLLERPRQLWVRWPGGRTTTTEIPAHAFEVTVDASGDLAKISLRGAD